YPPTSTVRRPSGTRQESMPQSASPVRKSSSQKQPLAPDLSFGNGGSTVRVFRRVSSGSSNPSPEGSVVQRDENRPLLTETVTKEALLGRKIYSKAVDEAFQEVHAQTSNQA